MATYEEIKQASLNAAQKNAMSAGVSAPGSTGTATTLEALRAKYANNSAASGTTGTTAATQKIDYSKYDPVQAGGYNPGLSAYTNPAYADSSAASGINNMYAASLNSKLANLYNAYQQNLSNAQAAYAEIDPAYQQRANDLGVQYERNRRNFNIQAAGNGLNTGVGSQAALAQNSAYQRDYGNLRVAQQSALNEAQRGIRDLAASYQNEANAAAAEAEFQRNQSLLNQYKTDYANKLTLASNLAKYGDFSGYKGIYSDAQIKQMEQNWIANNADLAYNTGKITADKYKSMTGKWPAGYTAPKSGGGGGGNYGGPANNTQAETDLKAIENAKTVQDASRALLSAAAHGTISAQQYRSGMAANNSATGVSRW